MTLQTPNGTLQGCALTGECHETQRQRHVQVTYVVMLVNIGLVAGVVAVVTCEQQFLDLLVCPDVPGQVCRQMQVQFYQLYSLSTGSAIIFSDVWLWTRVHEGTETTCVTKQHG